MGWGDRADRIRRSGPRTVWEQIAEDITIEIRTTRQPAGSKLPAEDDLAEIYGVARATVRRAIAELVVQGLLVVRHGRGTFVAQRRQ